MTARTRLWGMFGKVAKKQAAKSFSKLPPLVRSMPVGLESTEKAWGVPGCDALIANDVPKSMLGIPNRATAALLSVMFKVIPNTQQKTRWDLDTATEHLVDIFGGEGQPELWEDWQSDAGWARTFVQGPCAGDLTRDGDVWVVDASALALGERKPGVAPLGVKVAIHVDDDGVRPAWILMENGIKVTPYQAQWSHARLVASAAMNNWVSTVRHVVFLHYIAGQQAAILVHNHLPWEHPLHRLLYPHVAYTLVVNWTASASFMWPGRVAASTYAFTWKGVQQLVPVAFGAFNWDSYNMPEVFRKRGTQELIDKGQYPYGEDALLLWNTIDDYVGDYLSQYYAGDAAVAGDQILQDGLAAMDTVLPGQTLRATTVAQLRLVLTRFIHMISVEHRLVSGIVYDFFSHPYFFPALAREGANAEESNPFREESEAHLMFRYGISEPGWPLMADWTYVALDEKGSGAMQRFQSALMEAGKEIDRRNATRRHPFPYLHPSGLESSIAV